MNNSLEGEPSKKTHTKSSVESVLEDTTRAMQHVKVKNENTSIMNLRQDRP